ncbi:MAG TPA: hypothetical protein VEQ63_09605, partial [Bryobacteraceae bacterium]|nr:hypothetical protein [Bryobacteraceae bacterium]
SRSDQTLMNLYAVAASALNVPLGAANYERVGSTDSESFTGVVPRITISSITDANIRLLHSGRDKLSEIRLDDYVLTARLVQRYLRVLDEHLE